MRFNVSVLVTAIFLAALAAGFNAGPAAAAHEIQYEQEILAGPLYIGGVAAYFEPIGEGEYALVDADGYIIGFAFVDGYDRLRITNVDGETLYFLQYESRQRFTAYDPYGAYLSFYTHLVLADHFFNHRQSFNRPFLSTRHVNRQRLHFKKQQRKLRQQTRLRQEKRGRLAKSHIGTKSHFGAQPGFTAHQSQRFKSQPGFTAHQSQRFKTQPGFTAHQSQRFKTQPGFTAHQSQRFQSPVTKVHDSGKAQSHQQKRDRPRWQEVTPSGSHEGKRNHNGRKNFTGGGDHPRGKAKAHNGKKHNGDRHKGKRASKQQNFQGNTKPQRQKAGGHPPRQKRMATAQQPRPNRQPVKPQVQSVKPHKQSVKKAQAQPRAKSEPKSEPRRQHNTRRSPGQRSTSKSGSFRRR